VLLNIKARSVLIRATSPVILPTENVTTTLSFMFIFLFKIGCEAAGLAGSAGVTLSTLRVCDKLSLVRTATGRVFSGNLRGTLPSESIFRG
jgi:hypothetical protein